MGVNLCCAQLEAQRLVGFGSYRSGNAHIRTTQALLC